MFERAIEARSDAAAQASSVPAYDMGVVVCVERVERLAEALRPEWQALERDVAEPNSFAEWWFASASLRHLAPPGGVRLALVRRAGQLIGTALFHCEEQYGRARIPHVENWLHDNQFLGAPLVRRGEEEAFWRAILLMLDRAEWAPSFLHLWGMVEDSAVVRGLESAAGALGRACPRVHRRSRAAMASLLPPAEYLARNLSSKRRSELGRRRRRLAELGQLEIRSLDRAEEVDGWCDDFLHLERSGWKGAEGSALACSPVHAEFFREAITGAFSERRLHFVRMDLDERPIAMLTAFMAPPGAFGFKTAFDEGYARYSPGVLLQLDNLAELRRPGIEWIDSCSGEDQPTLNGLWSERREIVQLTVRLAGARRLIPFAAACALDRSAEALRPFQRRREVR